MTTEATGIRTTGPDTVRPVLIAHAAGNTSSRARRAIAEGADYLEVDLWVHANRFEARHERRLHPLPLLWEDWQVRWAPRFAFGLKELLLEADGRAGIFLDFKNGGETAARLVRRSLDEAHVRPRISASSQHWHTLRALARVAPEVDLYYSIDVQAKLDLLLSVAQRDTRPRGVSCNHPLLTRTTVDRLKQAGLEVVAWTVDDLSRAMELVSWGVDGITTHRVAAFRESLCPVTS